MAASDIEIFRVAGDPIALGALEILLSGPATQKEIATAIGASSAQLSRSMASLEGAGLVRRGRSHGPYELLDAARTADVLLAVTGLQESIAETQLNESKSRRTRLLRVTGRNRRNGDDG